MELTDSQTVTVHDELTATFKDSDGITVADDEVSFDWDSIETVTVDSVAIADHFETKEFYKIPTTVAKPIVQPYNFNDSTVLLKKPADELQKAAWSLDNKPWTMDHPNTDSGMVKSTEDIRGFWKNPRWVDSLDDLDADLHIPVNDEEAQTFVEEHTDVSVGFRNTLVPTTMYDSETDESVVDGYQTDMYFDHVASVGVGRCPSDAGCGINPSTDSSDVDHSHGTVIDESTYLTKEEQTVIEGDVFADEEMALERAKEMGCDSTHQMGDMYVPCASHEMYTMMTDGACDDVTDCPWARKESVDVSLPSSFVDEAPESARGFDEDTLLRTAQCIDAPHCDLTDLDEVSVSEDESEEFVEYVTEAADRLEDLDDYLKASTITNDSRDGTTINVTDYSTDGEYYAISPEESSSDEPKYPINTCSDVQDAWDLRKHGDFSVSVSTLEDRIKRRASELDCSDESRPWTNDTTDTIMTELEDMSLDAIVDSHDGVEALKSEVDELSETVSQIREALDADEDESLVDAASETAELAEDGEEYRSEQIDEHVEAITSHTDRYDEDELREKKLAHLGEIRAVVEDAAESASATDSVANSGDGRVTEQHQTGTVDSPWE